MKKIPDSVVKIDNCLTKDSQLSILPTESEIFDIRQHYERIL